MPGEQAAIYLRVSTVEQASEPVQLANCQEQAARRGLQIYKVYTDHGESAWSAGRDRPQWNALVADAAAGKFTALMGYENSRLWRDPQEFWPLFGKLGEYGVTRVVIGSSEYKTDDNRARGFLGIMTIIDDMSSADTQRRVQDTIDANTAAGKPFGGRTPFGFDRISPDRGLPRSEREQAQLVVNEEQARHIRAAKDHILAGGSLRSVARDWQDNVATVTGGRWTNWTVKRILTAPRTAGLREYGAGRRAKTREIVGTATWEGIITPDERLALIAILFADGRGPRGASERVYLLTGLLYGTHCGHRLVTRPSTSPGGSYYGCAAGTHGRGGGGVAARALPTDAFVLNHVLGGTHPHPDHGGAKVYRTRVDWQSLAESLRPAAEGGVDLPGLRGQLRAAESRLDGLAESYADGDVDARSWSVARERLNARIAELRAEHDDAVRAKPGLEIVSAMLTGEDRQRLQDKVERWPLLLKRQLIDQAIDRITVYPSTPGWNKRYADPRRFAIEWKNEVKLIRVE